MSSPILKYRHMEAYKVDARLSVMTVVRCA